jgi:hypothetical protein
VAAPTRVVPSPPPLPLKVCCGTCGAPDCKQRHVGPIQYCSMCDMIRVTNDDGSFSFSKRVKCTTAKQFGGLVEARIPVHSIWCCLLRALSSYHKCICFRAFGPACLFHLINNGAQVDEFKPAGVLSPCLPVRSSGCFFTPHIPV